MDQTFASNADVTVYEAQMYDVLTVFELTHDQARSVSLSSKKDTSPANVCV